jgi:hypothetical protein
LGAVAGLGRLVGYEIRPRRRQGGFWSLIKRGCVGTFHKASKKYLHLYVAEFQFRYNNRHNEDIFGTAIGGC